MLRHTDGVPRARPSRSSPTRRSSSRAWTATTIRAAHRRRRLPVHQRVRGRAHRVEDRLDAPTRSSTASAPASRRSAPRARRSSARASRPSRSPSPVEDAQGRPHGRRRRVPRRLRRPGSPGASASSAARRSARRSPPTSSRRSARRSTSSSRRTSSTRFERRLRRRGGRRGRAAPARRAAVSRRARAEPVAVPVEPPPTPWHMPGAGRSWTQCGDDLVAVGADLEPATLLAAYRHGLFPMPVDDGTLGWWSPDPRGVLPLGRAAGQPVAAPVAAAATRSASTPRSTRSSRALRRPGPTARLDLRGHPRRLPPAARARLGAQRRGVGRRRAGRRAVRRRRSAGLFAGESMFHRAPDASKVALVALVDLLRADGDGRRLLDVQWATPHLASLGVVEVARARLPRGCSRRRARGARAQLGALTASVEPVGRREAHAVDGVAPSASGGRSASSSWPRIAHQAATSVAAAGSSASRSTSVARLRVAAGPREVDDRQRAEPARESTSTSSASARRSLTGRPPRPRRAGRRRRRAAREEAVDVVARSMPRGSETRDVAVRQRRPSPRARATARACWTCTTSPEVTANPSRSSAVTSASPST